MAVQQFSVFVENAPGSLAKFAGLLAERGIDLVSLTMADTTHFGILRGIADDNALAAKVLTENGYTVKMNRVLAVALPDRPGGFARMLKLLADGSINVEYLYSTVRSSEGMASVILRVDDTVKAEEMLKDAGIRLLTQQELCDE